MNSVSSSGPEFGVDLYWLPLGAGGHFVRFNGRLYEALVAACEGRPRRDLYHSALEVRVPEAALSSNPRRSARAMATIAASSARAPWEADCWGAFVSSATSCVAGATATSLTIRSGRQPDLPRTDPRVAERARSGAATAPARLGPGRARRRRDVELELDHRLAARRTDLDMQRSGPRSAAVRLAGTPASSSPNDSRQLLDTSGRHLLLFLDAADFFARGSTYRRRGPSRIATLATPKSLGLDFSQEEARCAQKGLGQAPAGPPPPARDDARDDGRAWSLARRSSSARWE